MSTCVFGWPIYSDTSASYSPSLSGGSWSSSLPLANLQDRRLGKIARSADATAASTKIIIDLGVARSVGVLAVLIPNLTKSSTPTIQWKGGTSSGASDVYNPGAVQAWPTGVTLEDVTKSDGSQQNIWLTTVPPSPQTARYWELDIVDTANSDGYLNVARLCICGAFTPTVNVNDGDRQSYESDTVRSVTPGGAALYDVRASRRAAQFSIENLPTSDIYASVRAMQRRLGLSGQFLWIPDPADTTYGYERNFLAVMRELGPLESQSTRYNTTFSVVEEL